MKKEKEKEKEKQTELQEEQVADAAETDEQNVEVNELDKIKQELNEKADRLLRTLAEYDNFRKRSQKEKEGAYEDSKALVLKKLLPVIDNIERAQVKDETSLEDYKKGVDMIFDQFMKAMTDMGVTPFGEKGDKFDPLLHNAVMHIEDENLGENVIAQVFEKGYMLGDRVLRPATVQVAN